MGRKSPIIHIALLGGEIGVLRFWEWSGTELYRKGPEMTEMEQEVTAKKWNWKMNEMQQEVNKN